MQFCLLLCVSPAYAQVCERTHMRGVTARMRRRKKYFLFFLFVDKNVAFLSIAPTQLKGAEGD